MKKSILIIISCFIITISSAQTIKQLKGKAIDISQLTNRLNHITDSAGVTGLQVAVINNNRIAYTHSFGLKDTEKQLKLDDSTAMYAASLTKTVSAYLFLRLVDKGVFNLDKPVQQYLKKPIGDYPKWKDLGDDTASFNKITPRMLLSHSSGMPVLRALYNNKVSLIARPGQKFYYSNEGFNLLGFMIEEYTGKRLEVLAKQEVFAPLNMTHTSMIWQPEFENDYAIAYFKDGKKYGSERRSDARAAGSMTTTAGDYAKFVIALQTRYGLSAGAFNEMFSPQIYIHTKKGFGPEKDSLTNEYQSISLSWGLGVGLIKSPLRASLFSCRAW